MKNLNRKHLILSIVAFILVLFTLVSFTYSWIDDVKLVEFQNVDLADNKAPLKTGTDINATVNITKSNTEIDLGKMLTESDITYEYQDGEESRKHIRYDSDPANANKNPNMDNIRSKRGYFYESGGMHLSPCYSDGENFFFKRQGQNGYREGNIDDENVNYISFTAKVSSPDATTDFWFESLPYISKHEEAGAEHNPGNELSSARFSIIIDGECHVYSSTGQALTCNSGLNGTEAVSGVRNTAAYTFDNVSNRTAERGENSNTLFTIKKGETVNMTVKIWLEGESISGVTASDINFRLVSSWTNTRKIYIVDKTTNGGGESWLNSDGKATLYCTFPEILKDINPIESEWENLGIEQTGPFYVLQTTATTGTYLVEVPLVYNNEKMILYRCNSSGWDKAGSDAVRRSEYNVYCWNWWQTNSPNTFKDEVYTLYGSSKDKTAYERALITERTDKGYGTWGDVEEIKVYPHYNNTDFAKTDQPLYLKDFTDEDASGETYIYEMYRASNNSDDPWKTYVPVSSTKIQFICLSGYEKLDYWGYKSWYENENKFNPQQRPLASSNLCPHNAVEYHFAARFGTGNNKNGWGYWKAFGDNNSSSSDDVVFDNVYLVRNGDYDDKTNNATHMWDDNTTPNTKDTDPMSRLKYYGTNTDVKWRDNSYVMKADSARQGTGTIYNNVQFWGYNANESHYTLNSGNLILYPGCFYEPSTNKWYGSIDDIGRDASSSVDPGGADSEDVGGGSMDGYTYDGQGFVFNINGNNYNAYANAAGTEFKVKITSLPAGTHLTTVKKNSTDYKNGQNYSIYDTREGMDLYLSVKDSGHNNDFAIKNNSDGNFIVTFQFDNGNTGTIKITSILKEG